MTINRATNELVAIRSDFSLDPLVRLAVPQDQLPFSYACLDRDASGQLVGIMDMGRTKIFNINEETGAFVVRTTSSSTVGPSITFDGTTIYSVSERSGIASGSLVRIAPDGTVTNIAAMTPSVLGIEFVAGRGIYVADEFTRIVYLYRESDGALLRAGSVSLDNFLDLDFGVGDGKLLMLTENGGQGNQLVEIDLDSLARTVVHTFPASVSLAGLAAAR